MNSRILVVDDNKAVRAALKEVLEQAGYEAVMAAGGLEAVVRCDLVPMDLVILDLDLPNQSGWEVLDYLSQHQPSLPVIILSALPEQSAPAPTTGAAARMNKPLDAGRLLDTIAALLADSAERRLQPLPGPFADAHYVPPAPCYVLVSGGQPDAEPPGSTPSRLNRHRRLSHP